VVAASSVNSLRSRQTSERSFKPARFPVVTNLLTHLAVNRYVSTSTQNQALAPLLILYRNPNELQIGLSFTAFQLTRPRLFFISLFRERGLHLEDVYRQLFNPDLYLRAYGRIYRNDGAMTKGMTEETVDDMSMQKIQRIIEAISMDSCTARQHFQKKWQDSTTRHSYVERQVAARSNALDS
jgi:hypothetical protein